jgi:cysteine-rich repeat protein
LFLTQFHPNESPVIRTSQPEDAIIFSCPAGTSIPVMQALSRFNIDSTNDMYVWGPYAGDEGTRLQNGEDPNAIFTHAKFYGRATGFPFVNSGGILQVPANLPQGEATFFASADVPAGMTNRVRCAVVQSCGDEFVDAPEQCDQGALNSDTLANACRTNCQRARCGDGVVDTGEFCDDGNTISNDACSNTCRRNFPVNPLVCGNGVVDTGIFTPEQCDDGNNVNGDGCSGTCTTEPGFTCSGQPSVCTLPTGSSSSGAPSSASSAASSTVAICGNAVTDPPGEQCDDGNTSNTDYCFTNCTLNVCGDGYVDLFIQGSCDDGMTCHYTDSNGNLAGTGNWCDTNADCQGFEVCGLYDGDGCNNKAGNCTKDGLYVCVLAEDKHSGVQERSVCTIAAP